jgi:hypothetical protein
MRLFRQRKPLQLRSRDGATRAIAAELSVQLSPEDLLSSLPVEFRDEVRTSHEMARKAREEAQSAGFWMREVERRLAEAPSADQARLEALEAELERVKAEIGQRTGRAL